jgi:hypothetical protein
MALKIPKGLGPCLDMAYKMRAARIEKQREFDAVIDALKADEKSLNDHIINSFKKSELEGAKGDLCSASLVPKSYPQVDTDNGGWDLIYKWVARTKAFDIFERRLSRKAVNDRFEAGEKIPGVKLFETVELSLTKR